MDIIANLPIVFGPLVLLSLLYLFWRLKSENEELKKEVAKLKDANEEYPSRDLSKIEDLMRKATQEISILGLVGWEPIHQARSTIVDFINKRNGKVRILIANPESKYFRDRALREKDNVGRLDQEHKLAITELKCILREINPARKGNFIIRLYSDLPEDISFQMIDNKEMYVNERIDKEGVRGYESPMFKVSIERLAQRKSFEYYKKIFEDTWNNRSTKEITLNA